MLLRQDPALFWEMTPREIQACFRAHRREQETWRILAGTVSASIFNARRSKDSDKFFTWTDFFRPLVPEEKKHQSDEAISAKLDMFAKGATTGKGRRRAKAEQAKQQNAQLSGSPRKSRNRRNRV